MLDGKLGDLCSLRVSGTDLVVDEPAFSTSVVRPAFLAVESGLRIMSVLLDM